MVDNVLPGNDLRSTTSSIIIKVKGLFSRVYFVTIMCNCLVIISTLGTRLERLKFIKDNKINLTLGNFLSLIIKSSHLSFV